MEPYGSEAFKSFQDATSIIIKFETICVLQIPNADPYKLAGTI